MGHATPFLVTDCDVVAARLDSFRQSMHGIQPYFALKCNAARPVLATLAGGGAGFEIASVYELDSLRAVGVDGCDVLFSNTVKPEPHIREAALQGVWRFALDSEGELLKVAAAAPGSAIYVRLNVEDSHSLFPLSRKFGTSADEALRLLRMAPECGLRPYGLTFHVGSQCTDPSMYSPRDRALWPRDAPARAVRHPDRDAQHRRRHARDLLRAGARHPRGGQRRRRPPSAAFRTGLRSWPRSLAASWSPRAACWWRR